MTLQVKRDGIFGITGLQIKRAGVWVDFALPAGDVTPPGPVTNISRFQMSNPDTQIVLGWSDPEDLDLAGVTVRRAEGVTAPATIADGILVTDAPVAQGMITDTGLTPSTQYSYTFWAHDISGNYSTPVNYTGSTDVPPSGNTVIDFSTMGDVNPWLGIPGVFEPIGEQTDYPCVIEAGKCSGDVRGFSTYTATCPSGIDNLWHISITRTVTYNLGDDDRLMRAPDGLSFLRVHVEPDLLYIDSVAGGASSGVHYAGPVTGLVGGALYTLDAEHLGSGQVRVRLVIDDVTQFDQTIAFAQPMSLTHFIDVFATPDYLSKITVFAPAEPPADPLAGIAIGDAFMDGYFAGIIDTTQGNIIPADASQVGERYALIVSPKSMETNCAYRTPAGAPPVACQTLWDGLSATNAALSEAASFPAAEHSESLAYPSDEGSKWYVPALDEMEFIYRGLKPTTEPTNAFGPRSYDGFPDVEVPQGYNQSSDPIEPGYSGGPVQTTVAAFQDGGPQALFVSPTAENVYYWTSSDQSGQWEWIQGTSGPVAGYQAANMSNATPNVPMRPVRRLVL